MTVEERKKAIEALGERLRNVTDDEFEQLSLQAINQNTWFTKDNVKSAINAWAKSLTLAKIEQWTKDFSLSPKAPKQVGLILAGNIPLVGLHDLLSVLISGHHAAVKFSSQDKALMQFVISSLKEASPAIAERIQLVEQMKDVDAVIATGSDNTARYFKQYFGNKPHIIRQNRTSIGILNGKENETDIKGLGIDVFTYYGLGCRNVSKIFIPKDFDLVKLIDGLMPFQAIIEHHKFNNNYDYNKSIYLVNGEPHLDSGFFLMRETKELVSPISVIYYERYDNEAQLALRLAAFTEKTQCIVSKDAWYPNSLAFGKAQTPELWDYADGVNTLEFLSSLN